MFDFPIGFIFGYVVILKISRKSSKSAKFSPKILALFFTVTIGYTSFFGSEASFIADNLFLTTICSLLFLFCIEGAFFKMLPIGGNEYMDAFKDSNFLGKVFSTLVLIFSIWSFVRLIVIPVDGEVANFSSELANMGEYAIYFGFAVFVYAVFVLIAGLTLVTFGEESKI